MPTTLTPDEHVAALRSHGRRLLATALDAGLHSPVPTCPGWTAEALVAHQAMVHRWAAAQVTGDGHDSVLTDEQIRSTVDDLPAYYREGHSRLCDALQQAPDDLEAVTFLNDAPPPRAFWARRQAHETTIHLADATAAALGRLPGAADIDISPALAADGIDELLRGFFTRGKSKLYDGTAFVVDIVADDLDRRWTLHVGPELSVGPDTADGRAVGPGGTADGRAVAAAGSADTTIRGTAAGLYLALWNRGTDVTVTGRTGLLDRWRTAHRVSWG